MTATSPKARRLADVPTDPDRARLAAAVRRAALDVLPEQWRVLPDGRATHAVIAARLLRDTREGRP